MPHFLCKKARIALVLLSGHFFYCYSMESVSTDTYSSTPSKKTFHRAVRMGNVNTVLSLIKKGTDINAKTDDLENALHLATKKDDLPMVMTLMKAGINRCTKNKDGKTPLILAAELGFDSIFKYLLRKVPSPLQKDNNGEGPLDIAYKNQNFGIIQILAENGIKIWEVKAANPKARSINKYIQLASSFHVAKDKTSHFNLFASCNLFATHKGARTINKKNVGYIAKLSHLASAEFVDAFYLWLLKFQYIPTQSLCSKNKKFVYFALMKKANHTRKRKQLKNYWFMQCGGKKLLTAKNLDSEDEKLKGLILQELEKKSNKKFKQYIFN